MCDFRHRASLSSLSHSLGWQTPQDACGDRCKRRSYRPDRDLDQSKLPHRLGPTSQPLSGLPRFSGQSLRTPKRIGEIAVFRAQKSNPVFKEGQIVAKRIRAQAGDMVEINPQLEILVNGLKVAQGLPYLKEASADTIRRYIGKRTLREGEYWVMGDSPTSYDSRYWGVLHENQIIGKGYALF